MFLGNEFAEFLGVVILVYNDGEQEQEYRTEVKIDFINKSQKDLEGNLIIGLQFTRLTNWFVEQNRFVEIINSPTKTYPYIYPFSYGDQTTGGALITNNSNLPAYLKIEAFAELAEFSEIQYEIVDLRNNSIVQSFKYNPIVAQNEKLTLDSKLRSQEVYKINGIGIKTNEYQNVDFNREIFLFIPPGTWGFRVTSVSTEAPNVKLFYNEEVLIV